MKKRLACLILSAVLSVIPTTVNVEAAGVTALDTGISYEVYAAGQYINWDGVSTVAQFSDLDREFAFAYKSGENIKVVFTEDGEVKKNVTLKMKGELFGTVDMDSDGNIYAVTGTTNTGTDTGKETIFITKYNKKGKLIKTIGDNGSASLASYYDSGYYTASPFYGGGCDIAINGDYIVVDYGRLMYNGHQSNSVWVIDRKNMKTVRPVSDKGWSNYQSHSLGQRVVSTKSGFALMGEGDAYDRAFTFSTIDMSAHKTTESNIFDFWLNKTGNGNDNYAHIGNICALNNGKISFVAMSAKAMDSSAEKQREQVFIQIFDPKADLKKESSYVTSGTRKGKAGHSGDESKTNYGVKWLTDYKKGMILDVQAVTDLKSNTIIFYERYDEGTSYFGTYLTYDGLYTMTVDSTGKVKKKAKKISETAHLNSCETPVYSYGYVYWCENDEDDYAGKELKVYRYKP